MRVVSARNLLDKQTFGRQDPYCKVSVRNKTFKTRVHDNGHRTPVWNEKFVFEVFDPQLEQLHVQIKDKNFTASVLIGEVRLPVNMFIHGNVTDQWYTVNNGSRSAGEVNLRVQLIGGPNGAASAPHPEKMAQGYPVATPAPVAQSNYAQPPPPQQAYPAYPPPQQAPPPQYSQPPPQYAQPPPQYAQPPPQYAQPPPQYGPPPPQYAPPPSYHMPPPQPPMVVAPAVIAAPPPVVVAPPPQVVYTPGVAYAAPGYYTSHHHHHHGDGGYGGGGYYGGGGGVSAGTMALGVGAGVVGGMVLGEVLDDIF